MKNILRNIAIASVVATGLAVTSCEDMMTVDTGDKAYQNAQDTLYSYLGIMRAMQDVAERQVILGEIRGDLVSSSDYTTDTLFAISNFDNPQDQSCSMLNVRDYYNVINNCNFYIHYADTSAVRANNPDPYMMNEYAQVKAIRAWAYLQLVKNYRAVPYITEPVSSLDVIENFDYNANLVTKDNLVDRIIEDGLAKEADRPFPQYGNPSDVNNHRWGIWDTGNVDVSARLCFIPIRVILGDLYLLRGAAGDYETAALYYYNFLKNETTPMPVQYSEALSFSGNKVMGGATVNGWGRWAASYNYDATTNEVISLIPSASNAGFGKMLTRVADIYGYTPSSSQSSDLSTTDGSTNTDANGDDLYEAKGAISVTPTYKRQYGPSNAYQDIANQQTYIRALNNSVTNMEIYPNVDVRYNSSIEETRDDLGDAYALCSKAAKGITFYYTIPTYRKSLIWLRLAEAINRVGYPEFAFAILKDGLNRFTIPNIVDKSVPTGEEVNVTEVIDGVTYYLRENTSNHNIVYVVDTGDGPNYNNPRYTKGEDGKLVEYTGRVISGWNWVTIKITREYRALAYNEPYRPLQYASNDEEDTLRVYNFKKFLDFSGDVWNGTYGIHAKGTGGFISNTTAQYKITTITGNIDKGNYDYKTLLEQRGVDPSTDDINDVINAVEDIIVDELALETAFEGNRFTDLVRIAEHKNASGYNGTEWLAKKIANRGTKAATESAPGVDGFNSDIYSKLLNTNNWYFELPKWTTK